MPSIAISHDGKTLASGSWDRTIKLWDLETGSLLRTFIGHTNLVDSVAFSPDGRYIASGSWDKTIRLWNSATGDLLDTISYNNTMQSSVIFSPDGKTIAATMPNEKVKLWKVNIPLLELYAEYAQTQTTIPTFSTEFLADTPN